MKVTCVACGKVFTTNDPFELYCPACRKRIMGAWQEPKKPQVK